MSYLMAAPEFLVSAASDLEGIRSALGAANLVAAAPTGGVLAAGVDEVSAAIASLFAGHAQAYQTLSAQAATFHQQFVRAMTAAANSYAGAEAASASPLQAVSREALNAVNTPTEALLGRPLVGNGTPGTATDPNGGAGGLLYGNGGNGYSFRAALLLRPVVAVARRG